MSQAEPSNSNGSASIRSVSLQESAGSTSGIQDDKEGKEEKNERKEQQDRSTSSHVPGSQAGKQEAGVNGQQTEDFTTVKEPQALSQEEQDLPVPVTSMSQAEPSNSNGSASIRSVSLQESAGSTSGIQEDDILGMKNENEGTIISPGQLNVELGFCKQLELKNSDYNCLLEQHQNLQKQMMETDEDLQCLRENLDREIAGRREEFLQHSSMVTGLKKKLNETTEQKSALQKQLKKKENELSTEKKGKEMQQCTIRELKDQVEELNNNIKDKDDENKDLTTSLGQLKDERDDFHTQLEHKNRDYNSLQEQHQTLLNQMIHMIGEYLKNAD